MTHGTSVIVPNVPTWAADSPSRSFSVSVTGWTET